MGKTAGRTVEGGVPVQWAGHQTHKTVLTSSCEPDLARRSGGRLVS